MNTNPKKDRTQVDCILLEQFRRKGYVCEEIQEQDATIFIITHEKKNTDMITQVMGENYKDLLRTN
jgi:hypothetical protein